MKRTIFGPVPVLLVVIAVGCGSKSSPPGDGSPSADADASTSPPNGTLLVSGATQGATPRADAGSDATAADDATAGPSPDASSTQDVAVDSAPDVSTVNQCGYSQCPAGGPCADLTIDRNAMANTIVINSQDFTATSCEVTEGCIVAPGTRRLLRFDLATVNVGNADLVLGAPVTEACFQYSSCHGHYHFLGFAKYTLYRTDGTTVAAVGHKQSFCIEDVVASPMFDPAAPNPAQPFDCNRQGLHVGWSDVYPNDVPCQWVDITDVPPGDYVLAAIVNAAQSVPELNYANNEVRVPVTIPPSN